MDLLLQPSVQTTIIDNSQVFITAQGLTVLFAAFKAASGPDNKIQRITSESEFLFYYGQPNMRLYGQTAYNVVNWVKAGGVALCTRVLPIPYDSITTSTQVSTYSCYILEVGTKSTLVNDVPTNKQIKIRTRILGDGRGRLTTDEERNLRNDRDFQDQVLAQPLVADSNDGFTYYPILLIRDRYRGGRLNTGKIKIKLLTSLDNTYDHRLYNITLYNSSSSSIESFNFSLYPEAVDISNRSQFITNVLKTYSGYMSALFNEAGYDAVATFINSDVTLTKEIDILTLQERNINVNQTLHTGVTIGSGSAVLTELRSIGGGSEGVWANSNTLDNLLFKAYSGSGDRINQSTGLNEYDTYFSDILDTDANRVDIILDANYSSSVKNAISTLCQNRGDCLSILDIGFTSSAGQALAYRKDSLPVNTFYSAIFTQDFTVNDTYQGGEIQVTPTYFLATKIPYTDVTYGVQYPFVGPRRGILSGFNDISWVPNEPYRELLYSAQLNYVQRDTTMTRFNCQLTSQTNTSALSDIPHVRVLFLIRRNVQDIAKTFEFEFDDPQSWTDLQYQINSYCQTWVSNRALSTVTATVYASAYDKQQKIVRVDIQMTFTSFIEKVMINLIVNK
jgi:hypothetical protein